MKSSIGGILQGISLDAFLQMAQMEQITCTLSVTAGNRTGRLFLLDGKLISAETGDFTQLEAACRIISWEKTVIEITESCSKTTDEIKQPLMNVLMEAMRRRDDTGSDPSHEIQPSEKSEKKLSPATPSKSASPEKAPPLNGSATTRNKTGNSEKQSDPGTKAVMEAEKPSPAATQNRGGTSPKPRGALFRLPWKPLAAGLIILIAAGGLVIHFLSIAKQNRLTYETFVINVRNAETLEQKLALMNTYIRENPDSAHSEEVIKQVQTLTNEIEERAFKAIEETASRLASEGALEAAAVVYREYLADNKDSHYAGSVSTALKGLSNQMEERAFQEMQATAETVGPERIFLYRAFLEQYPGSNHNKDILHLISNMEDEFFNYVERNVQENEKKLDWAACIDLSRKYFAIYPESRHAEVVTKWLVRHREEYQESQSFEHLCEHANRFGTDHEAALAVFSDYLQDHPGTPVKEKIEREMERLHSLSAQKRLLDATTRISQAILSIAPRFSIEKNETVLDTKTGLMWCLLDSQVTENRCLTFEEASTYVSSLETGGYDDWRLPSPEELSALYGKTPAFPFDTGTWYWSSKTEKRYISQWIINVQVIDPSSLEANNILIKESWRCGAVRAVRRNK